MALEFACPQCRKTFSVANTLAGKKARCKQCGHVFHIPAPRASVRKASSRPAAGAYELAQPRSVSRPARPADDRADALPERLGAPRKTGVKKARQAVDERVVWGVSAVVAAGLIAAVMMVILRNSPNPPHGEYPPAVLIGPMLVALGTLVACVLDWDWFFEGRKARTIVALFGRDGARVFYIILSGVLLGIGAEYLIAKPRAKVAPVEAATESIAPADERGIPGAVEARPQPTGNPF
ncbi:MAG: Imm17 family immunity protein [Isosphaeraceae bacterium]|nr:Imm17 family immunity protein [Isosphaeraceae bacterium]